MWILPFKKSNFQQTLPKPSWKLVFFFILNINRTELLFTFFNVKTACDLPPVMINGRHNGSTTDRPTVNTIFEYKCNEDYYPNNPDKLKTQCLSNGEYSTTNMSICVPFGLLKFNLLLKKTHMKAFKRN